MESISASFATRRSTLSTPTSSSTTQSTRVYHVTDYGADPTGSTDSTAAIKKAIADAFGVSSNDTLTGGIPDLGGAEVYLDGGTYLINGPLVLPASGGGNFKIHGGSLRASNDFPTDRYLIELWVQSGSGSSSLSYFYEYVTLRDMLLDCNYRGGGIAIVGSLRILVDNCYIVHFESDGIWVQGGHETYIQDCYIGQHPNAGGDPDQKNFSGNGINLAGDDNSVTNVVVFAAATGILVTGQANTLTGVHCYNKATGLGGIGIHLNTPGLTQTRIINCYFDWTGLVSEDPVLLHVSSSFFLGDANVMLKSVNGIAKDVVIVGNLFAGTGKGVDIVQLDESSVKFTNIDQVYVEQNVATSMTVRATAAKMSVEGNASSWTVDFSPVLLFPDRIGNVQYTLMTESAFPMHMLRNISENRVVIAADVTVPATVHVMADQNAS